ncbi:MAG: 4Fe-4S cluster-binding domain-containing protein [Lachnospiraceae bacterium]|nr:4Fe-4S cluster-binding domain-containing protein [Lachnospiraceae bacterium]
MKILQNISKVVSKLLENQVEKKDTQYRYISYCVSSSIPGGMLLYNTLTQELLQVSNDELTTSNTKAFLVEHWFLVPLEFDDYSLYDNLYSCLSSLHSEKGIGKYTILTTTHCNARCAYCFENNRIQSSMTDDTAQLVSQFIQRNHNGKPVLLRWFGGEPLVNQRAIEIITRSLSESDIPYYSSMVTNGYLFNHNNIKEAATKWHLKQVQITLDGCEKEYNQTKNYVNAVGSPYQTVLTNIDGLLHENIHVEIRLNISQSNPPELMRLVDELSDRFGSNDLLNIYPSFLVELKSSLSEKEIQQYASLQNRISDAGYAASKASLSQSLPLNRCMADDPGSIVINPDGYLSKCEYAYHSDWCGNISSDAINRDIASKWCQRSYPDESCKTCALRPLCLPLRHCVENGSCSKAIKSVRMIDLKQKMYYKYRKSIDK